jgi:hypothetical protein
VFWVEFQCYRGGGGGGVIALKFHPKKNVIKTEIIT